MLLPLHILADDGDTLGKIIFGLIALVIWGFSALASWINKQQQEAKRRKIRDTIQPVQRRMPPPASARPVPPPMQRSGPITVRLPSPPPIQSPRQIAEGLARRHPEVLPPDLARHPRPLGAPLPQPARPRALPQKPPKPKKRPAQRNPVQAPPIEQPILELDVIPAPRLATPPIPRSAAHARSTAAPATPASIRRWLTPQTLRSQFILTELLQPPLALRESRQV